MATRTKIVSANFDDHTLRVWDAPNADGDQQVHSLYSPETGKFPEDIQATLRFIGFQSVASNFYTRLDNASPENVRAVLDKVAASMADGTWEPGRQFAASEPTDIELAIAEAKNLPVHVVQEDIETRMKLGTDGQPERDQRGRTKRVFTKKVLDAIAKDPKIAPILARIAQERARAVRKDGQDTGLLDMFASSSETVAA